MRAKRPFLMKAKPSLLSFLEGLDEFYRYLAKDVIMTAELSDRHGLDFGKLIEQIKESYLASISASLPQIDASLGFDYYWTLENYGGRVTSLNEVLFRAELVTADTPNEELNYLIQTNIED